MATGADGSCHGGASTPPVVVSRAAHDVFDESVYERSKAPPRPPPPWADVPADILGTVLRRLPCAADRASVRSVCRHWRAAAACVQAALPAPLPVLVLRTFRFSCLTSDGSLTVPRRAVMPVEAAADDVWIMGVSYDWLLAVRSGNSGNYFLVNAFSSEVVHLPRLQSNLHYKYECLDESRRAGLVGEFFGASLLGCVLSAPPSSVSNYIVAAYTYRGRSTRDVLYGLALWQPGMTSWYLCLRAQINYLSGDLAFYQRKLYMVWMYTPDVFAFELREDENGVSLSSPKKINLLIPSRTMGSRKCNLVVWRGKLLLIIRFFSDSFCYKTTHLLNVEVFVLDSSTSPCGVTEIHNLDGDCIFVQKSGSRSFSAGLHLGDQGDLIYFLDEAVINQVSYTYVYNMREGTLRRIANSGVLCEHRYDFPFWIFPSS